MSILVIISIFIVSLVALIMLQDKGMTQEERDLEYGNNSFRVLPNGKKLTPEQYNEIQGDILWKLY